MTAQLKADHKSGGSKSNGFATPTEDKAPQRIVVPPGRVVPIVFLPGIMGSNLRVNQERQQKLRNTNNAAWQPDKVDEVGSLLYTGPARRQLLLDPDATQVDIYEPDTNPTGDSEQTADERHSKVAKINVDLPYVLGSPLLVSDPLAGCNSLSIEEKARHRGWGEVFFGSYRSVLEFLEEALNSPKASSPIKQIIGVDPKRWQITRYQRRFAWDRREVRETKLSLCDRLSINY